MGNKRIYQLADAADTAGRYIPLDKSGNAEAERLLVTQLLPQSIYRANVETVTAGTTTIVFGVGSANPFPAGTTYEIVPVWGSVGPGEGVFNLEITNKTINGFDATTTIDCSFLYLAIIPN